MLFVAWACCDGARAGRISFAKADSLLAQRNPVLRSARLDVTVAEGLLTQSRSYPE